MDNVVEEDVIGLCEVIGLKKGLDFWRCAVPTRHQHALSSMSTKPVSLTLQEWTFEMPSMLSEPMLFDSHLLRHLC